MHFNKTLKSLSLAAGTIALCGGAVQAQGTTTTTTTSVTTTSSAPLALSGTVTRYYVDRSGFVTAMDIQTAEGSKWVRFSPSWAQRVSSTYPVGSTASIFVTQGPWGWELSGLGGPTPMNTWTSYSVTDLDLLKAPAYTTVGSKMTQVEGKITGYVADENGEILAIVLDRNKLVRIPMENRQLAAPNTPEGITPLFKGSDVLAVGYEEAPVFGSISPYEKRLVATSVVVDGRSLGAHGFGRVSVKKKDTLLGFDLAGLSGRTPEEVKAGEMGYSSYTWPTVSQ